MIDFVIRDCGHGEWLPIIQVVGTTRDSRFGNGEELYRGSRHPNREAAWNKVVEVWENSGRTRRVVGGDPSIAETGNIAEFKKERGIS